MSDVLDEINAMSGHEFEDWVAKMFERDGFHVEHTPKHADFGTDLILTDPNGKTIGVQVKLRTGRNVGVEAVQQCRTGMEHYGLQYALLVANTEFTIPAKKLSKTAGVEMWSGRDVAKKWGSPAMYGEVHVPKRDKKVRYEEVEVEEVEGVQRTCRRFGTGYEG